MLHRFSTPICLSLFAFGLVLAGCLPAIANAQEVSGAWVLLHSDDFDWRERGDRRQVARALARRVARLKDRVPLQAPDERARLSQREARLAGNDAATDPVQAKSRLYLSTSFQHRALHRLLDNILLPLGCIERADVVSREMACWSDAAVALLQDDQLALALQTLRKARRLPRQWETAMINRDPEVWYAQFGRGILSYVLTPYLRASDGSAS